MSSRVGRRAPRALAAVLAAALVAAPALLAPPPLQAQEAPDPEVSLRLTGLPLMLGPGTATDEPPAEAPALPDDADADDADADEAGADEAEPTSDAPEDGPPPDDLDVRVLLENVGERAVENMRLVIEVHPAVADRDALGAALDEGALPGGPVYVRDQPVRELEPLPPGGLTGVAETLDGGAIPWAEDGGVHPVRVAVLRGADVLDEVITGVVWLAERPAAPLLTTAVWPVDDRPWRTVRGHYPASAPRGIRPGQRLDVLVRGLQRHPQAGVLLQPAAHLLEDLDDQASGFVELRRQPDGTRETHQIEPEDREARRANDVLQRVRDVAGDLPHAPVSGPYADADLGALAGHGQQMRELGGELAEIGRIRLQHLLERPPDGSTMVLAAPVDDTVLDLLPANHLLLPPALVTAAPTDGLGALRAPSGRLLTATVGDPRLHDLLADPPTGHGSLPAAHRVLLETAVHWAEDPDTPGRPLGLHPPADWAPGPDVVERLLTGLQDAPWLDLVAPSEQTATARRDPTPLELVAPEPDRLSSALVRDLETALADLTAAHAAQPTDLDEDATVPARDFRELRTTLLRATSRWYGGGGEAEALIRDVQREANRAFGDVEVASGSRVTLTAESGQIPITLRRTRGEPITVRVEVASQGRLVWPEGRQSEELVLSDREAHTVSFQTRALSMGTFPVTVRVTDPSGERELERTTLSVRSTRVSGPALTATGGVVLALLLAGALRRRPRRHLTVVEPAVTNGDTDLPRSP